MDNKESEDWAVGYIYVIHCEGSNYYKIGMTRGIVGTKISRLSSLQVGCPYDLSLVLCCKVSDYMEAEKYLHGRFALQLVRGEWYDLCAENVREIHQTLITLFNTSKPCLFDR